MIWAIVEIWLKYLCQNTSGMTYDYAENRNEVDLTVSKKYNYKNMDLSLIYGSISF